MLCAGTGAAPMFQVIHAILTDEEDDTRLRLVYAASDYSCLMGRQEISEWRRFWNFSCLFLLSQEPDNPLWRYKHGEEVKRGHLTKSIIRLELGTSQLDKVMVLFCGTRSFDTHVLSCLREIGLRTEQYQSAVYVEDGVVASKLYSNWGTVIYLSLVKSHCKSHVALISLTQPPRFPQQKNKALRITACRVDGGARTKGSEISICKINAAGVKTVGTRTEAPYMVLVMNRAHFLEKFVYIWISTYGNSSGMDREAEIARSSRPK
ncbi:NADP-cytochrome b5 reductase [Plakobranchus ocellatus]|uniref:NADP-cytochrome b5 reductase n=1 Tax=Plakobranchus ocellatus TaxID=259542 RepID=A0AAV4A747_9GAST|nr:NADP-cytochrome b5 reductase [Plakobranchus ocellatus]